MALPAVCAIPCGRDHKGLPFGIQVAGPRGSDARVLAIAKSLEAAFAADPVMARPLPDLVGLAARGR
jgi:Asp-tRNA(Asn)/Glu-tRNA(Gln) amidotransferase A subunit family amidase